MARPPSTGSSRSGRCPKITTSGACPAGGGMTCCPRTAGSRPSTTSAATRGTGSTGRCRSSASRKSDGARSIERCAMRRSAPATAGAPTTTRRPVQGVSPYAINGDPVREERVTTNDAYLEPARDRPNLRIVGDALVDRVMLDGRSSGRRARAARRRVDHGGGRRDRAQRGRGALARHPPALGHRAGTRRRPARRAAPARSPGRLSPSSHCATRRSPRHRSIATPTCVCATRRASPERGATT